MPPHSLDQAYSHVVAAAVRNVRRLVAAGDLSLLEVEAEHLAFVADLLDRYLLHGRHGDPRFDPADHADYWNRVRSEYIARADPASVEALRGAWDFVLYNIDREAWDRQ